MAVVLLCPHVVEKGWELSDSSLVRALIPFLRALPLWPNHTQRPHLQIGSPWALGFQHKNLGGGERDGEEPESWGRSPIPEPLPRVLCGKRHSLMSSGFSVRFQPWVVRWNFNWYNFLIFFLHWGLWVWSLPFFMLSLWFWFQDYPSPMTWFIFLNNDGFPSSTISWISFLKSRGFFFFFFLRSILRRVRNLRLFLSFLNFFLSKNYIVRSGC